MSARDLLQKRITIEGGDTVWQVSPVVGAALSGKLLILDGLHRLHPSTGSVLNRFVIILNYNTLATLLLKNVLLDWLMIVSCSFLMDQGF